MELLPFIFGGPKQKEYLARLARSRPRRYRSRLVNPGDQVERWRELYCIVCEKEGDLVDVLEL